jgi:Tol biopolymer transport system component
VGGAPPPPPPPLGRHRPTLAEADALARAILDGVAAAHAAGLVHRDLKPGNILLAVTNDGLVPKITDFGLAKLLDAAPSATATRSGVGMGTPPYMAPEQIRDASTADARADVFSLGAILYELVSGARPFDGKDAWDIFVKIQAGDFAPPSERVADLPARMDRAIRAALVVDRDARIASVAALRFAWTDGAPVLPTGTWEPATVSLVRSWSTLEPALQPSHPDTRSPATWAASVPAIPGAAAAPSTPVERSVPPAPRATATPWLLAGLTGTLGALTLAARLLAPAPTVAAPPFPSFRQLTFESDRLLSPTLSPDGESLVYEQDGELFLRRLVGDRAIPLTADFDPRADDPAYSPDGARLALSTPSGLYVMGATGDSPRRVTDHGFEPSWSPDGRALLFTTEATEDPSVLGSNGDLERVDLASGTIATVLAGAAAKGAATSPDGKRIAWWDVHREIHVMDADGKHDRKVTFGGTAWHPVWTDAATIAYLSERNGAVNLWSLDVDQTADPTPLTAGMLGQVWSFAMAAGRIAYDVVDSRTTVYRMAFAADGTTAGPKPILHSGRRFAAVSLSPDGAQAVFDCQFGREDLFVARTDGTGLRQLTDDVARDRAPVWSPDGVTILFTSNPDGDRALYQIHPDGSGERRRDADPALYYAIWSPDGSEYAAVKGATQQTLLYRAADDHPVATIPGSATDWGPAGLLIPNSDATSRVVDPSGATVATIACDWPHWRGTHVLCEGRGTLTDIAPDGARRLVADVRPETFVDEPTISSTADGRLVVFTSVSETGNLWIADVAGR